MGVSPGTVTQYLIRACVRLRVYGRAELLARVDEVLGLQTLRDRQSQ